MYINFSGNNTSFSEFHNKNKFLRRGALLGSAACFVAYYLQKKNGNDKKVQLGKGVHQPKSDKQLQWRIQDLPDEGEVPTQKWGANLLLWPFSLENCMKMKNNWTEIGETYVPLDLPLSWYIN